jgi:hypothetical protein
MDTSFWNNLNKNIKFNRTKKQFFGKYLWRLEVKCEGADLTNLKYLDMQQEVAHRKLIALNRNYGGSWKTQYRPKQFDTIDYVLLQSIRNIRTTYADVVKIRVENPWIQFYTENEHDLQTVANSLTDPNTISVLTGPKSGTEELLKGDVIFVGDRILHKYKIMLRDGKYDLSHKTQILDLLEAQDENVKITPGLRYKLTRSYPGMWGAFVYVNDLGVAILLNLIVPGIVGKIYEVRAAE